MFVRCLHCHEPIELPDEGDLSSVHCSACGGSFSLVGESTASYPGAEVQKLGHFELIEQVGVGAFGSVWKACDTRLDRIVAVKVPRTGRLDADEAELFLREARAAAQLKHPNIVPVHEVGREGHTLYIVSDFVQGATLDDWLTIRRLTPREAAELCLQVAEALDHAHQSGVIHRDLKPGNIMLDLSGRPHLLDFGLARRVGHEATMTVEGRVLGTPAYMSPEQARGEGHTADHRTDIYSLGVVLFRLLTGELPFRGSARMLLVQILQDEPPSPRKLNSHVPCDLETICLRCLEKDPEKRYATTRTLAADLRHYLAGEPIVARPISRLARAWRWCKRKPVVAGLGTAVLGLLLTISIAAPFVAWREAELRQVADEKTEEAEKIADAEAESRREADHARTLVEKEAATRRRLLYISDMGQARQAWETGDIDRLMVLLRRHVPRVEQDDLRGFEWFYLWRLGNRESHATRIQLPGTVSYTALTLSVSRDGSHVAVAHPEKVPDGPAVSLVDPNAERVVKSFGLATNQWLTFVAVSQDGRFLAYPDVDRNVVLVEDLETEESWRIDAGIDVRAVQFSPDGKTLAIAFADLAIRLWDMERWDWATKALKPEEAARLSENYPPCPPVFSPDGASVICEGENSTIRAWSITTNEKLWTGEGHSAIVLCVAYSPDGKYVASASADSTVGIWDARTGKRLRTLVGARDEVRTVAFSPDGRLLAAGSRDRQIRIWLLPEFVEYGIVSGNNTTYGLGFLPDGRLVFGGDDGKLILRTVQVGDCADVLPLSPGSRDSCLAAFASDRCVITTTRSNKGQAVRRWNLTPQGANELASVPLECRAGSLAVSRRGLMAISDTESANVHLFDLQVWRPVPPLAVPGKGSASCIAFSPTGGRLALGFDDGSTIVWDVEHRQPLFNSSARDGRVDCVCFCPDEKTLLIGQQSSAVLWDVEQEVRLDGLGQRPERVTAVAADGKLLAAGHFVGAPQIDLWDRTSNQERGTLRGHSATVWGMALFGDGKTLVSVGGDRTVRLWDVVHREERFRLDGRSPVVCLAVSPNEEALAAGCYDGTIRLYRAASRKEVKAVSGWWRLPVEEPGP